MKTEDRPSQYGDLCENYMYHAILGLTMGLDGDNVKWLKKYTRVIVQAPANSVANALNVVLPKIDDELSPKRHFINFVLGYYDKESTELVAFKREMERIVAETIDGINGVLDKSSAGIDDNETFTRFRMNVEEEDADLFEFFLHGHHFTNYPGSSNLSDEEFSRDVIGDVKRKMEEDVKDNAKVTKVFFPHHRR